MIGASDFYLTQYFSRGIQFSRASLNGALIGERTYTVYMHCPVSSFHGGTVNHQAKQSGFYGAFRGTTISSPLFMRDKCIFSLFLILIFSAAPFFSDAHFFFCRSPFFCCSIFSCVLFFCCPIFFAAHFFLPLNFLLLFTAHFF